MNPCSSLDPRNALNIRTEIRPATANTRNPFRRRLLADGGVGLSGGEWQKLAIARAYMSSAQIFVFDEPTSALDAKSEQATFSRIKALARDASAIIISHRFSSVRMADRIYVMEGGTVVQSGTVASIASGGTPSVLPAPQP